MSRVYLLVAVAALSLLACDRQSSKKPQNDLAVAAKTASPTSPSKGDTFGAGVKLAEATSIDAILATPQQYAGKTVRVEGMITDVCPKRGCWMEIAGNAPGQKLRFKVTDGEMVFPMDAKGRKAVAEGVVAVRQLTLEETKQRAEYEAKEYGKPYDPASVTSPDVMVSLDGTGATIQ